MNLLPTARIPSFVQLQERLTPLPPPKSPHEDVQIVGITNPRTPPKKGKKLPKTIASSKRPFIESPSKVASSSKRSRSNQKTGPAGYDLCGIEVELETVISKELLPHVDGQVR